MQFVRPDIRDTTIYEVEIVGTKFRWNYTFFVQILARRISVRVETAHENHKLSFIHK